MNTRFMKICIYCICALVSSILTTCNHSTEPISPGLIGSWSGHIDNNAMQMSLIGTNDSLGGQISWQRNDTVYVFSVIGSEKTGTDSVVILLEPTVLFVSVAYLTGTVSNNTLTGTYRTLSSSIGLSSSGVWSATKKH